MPAPSVLFIADQVHAAYAPRLAGVLKDDGVSLQSTDSIAGIDDLADRADALLAQHQPDIACFACGPWIGHPGGDTLSLATFERPLLRSAESLRRWCGRQVVYVTTPPVEPSRFG